MNTVIQMTPEDAELDALIKKDVPKPIELQGKAARLKKQGYPNCVAANGTPCSSAGPFTEKSTVLLCGQTADKQPISRLDAKVCPHSPRYKH